MSKRIYKPRVPECDLERIAKSVVEGWIYENPLLALEAIDYWIHDIDPRDVVFLSLSLARRISAMRGDKSVISLASAIRSYPDQ